MRSPLSNHPLSYIKHALLPVLLMLASEMVMSKHDWLMFAWDLWALLLAALFLYVVFVA